MNRDRSTRPIDAFRVTFFTLSFTGYLKLGPVSSYWREKAHKIYRGFTMCMLLVYNLQYCICVYQVLGDIEKMVDSLKILIATINMFVKLLATKINIHRLHEMNDLLEDEIFSTSSPEDEELLKEQNVNFNRMQKIINIGIASTGVFWYASPVFNRLYGDAERVPAYFPFETEEWLGYVAAHFCLTTGICWFGSGVMALDFLIVGYYSQSTVQMSIIRRNLEHLADDGDGNDDKIAVVYKDRTSKIYQNRLVDLVKRYQKAVWLIDEIQDVSNIAMLVQFLCSTTVICSLLYKLTSLTFNLYLLHTMLYFSSFLLETFLYCYYGSQLEHESTLVNDSVYQSHWLNLSPRFRKLMLIAMSRWNQPVSPRAAGLVPLSLSTFVTILRASYTLYTILKESN